MSFRQDIDDTMGFREAYQPGLQALRAIDRRKVTARTPRRLAGSVDIDTALRTRFPHSSRWDYVVAWTNNHHSECLHWIEVHPADGSGAIAEVSDKLAWLISWLTAEGARLRHYRRRIVWIASGKSAFQQNSPQMKKLVSAGVHFAGGHYVIAG